MNGFRSVGHFRIFYGYYLSPYKLYNPGQFWKKIIIPLIGFRLGTWHSLTHRQRSSHFLFWHWRSFHGRAWLLTPHPPQEAPDLEEAAERALVGQALHRLVAHLPRPLDYVIVTRYGLHGRPPRTFATIGQTLGLTRQRAHQLHSEAILWLAHPAHSLALRKLLDKNTVADYQAYLARLRTWLRARRGIR